MSFFESDLVQEDLQNIFNTYHAIASMTQQLSTLDRESRIEHIGECKGLIEKQKVFFTRLCLAASNDAEAADMKVRINTMSQAFGYADLHACMDAMIKTLEQAERTV